MTYRAITVFIGNHLSNSSLDQAAASLAEWQQAGLVAIITRLPPHSNADETSSGVFARGAGIDEYIRIFDDKNDEAMRSNIAYLERRAKKGNFSLEWRTLPIQATVEDAAVHCRYTDLIVAAQPQSFHSGDEAMGWSSDELILATGVPCLFIPDSYTRGHIGDRVVIGWNSSREARRAIADAMPFLQAALEVIVVIINPADGTHGEEPGADIGRYLSRHGVHAQIEVHRAKGPIRSEILLRRCAEADATLLVIGGYGQPHMRKIFAGSATDHILRKATCPVFCSH